MSELEHPLAGYPRPPPRGEDLPYDDGEPMESLRHDRQKTLLCDSLTFAWRDRFDFFVGGNMFMYFSETQAKRNDFRGPDVFVVLGVDRLKTRRSWVVWEEDGRAPHVVIELLSPSTEHVDRGEKMDIYGRVLRVPAYFLYDPFTFVLEGYRLDERTSTYERLPPDDDGWVACEPLGLRLGVIEGAYNDEKTSWLRWIDGQGRVLPMPRESYDEAMQRADEERQRADEERQRADREKRRADALAARLAELESGRS